ncbi:MAG: biopolymer transporter ExbD [Planctomycetota bacterium]
MGKKKVRERGGGVDEAITMDLTPMIDVVFQMIMFFVIITDFTQKEIELLQLPWSTVGIDDEGKEKGRIIINITAPPKVQVEERKGPIDDANQIKVNGRRMTFKGLAEYLYDNGVRNPVWREPDNPKLSSRSVLIRCDEAQAFDYVKGVLQVCSLPDVAIYKIEIATAEELKKN